MNRLSPRSIERSGVSVSPILWQVRTADVPECILRRSLAVGATWFWLPAELPVEQIASLVGAVGNLASAEHMAAHFVLGIDADDTLHRANRTIEDRLAALGGKADAVILEGADATMLKGGRPFHRLTRLRDNGQTRLIFLQAADPATGGWMVEHTAAHAVALPYDLSDLRAGYSLLDNARELGTAIFASPSPTPAWTNDATVNDSLRYVVGDDRLTAIVRTLPNSPENLDAILETFHSPMPADERKSWWDRFSAAVPPPPKPRRGHPPDLE
jgi:hypothetical protein